MNNRHRRVERLKRHELKSYSLNGGITAEQAAQALREFSLAASKLAEEASKAFLKFSQNFADKGESDGKNKIKD